MHKKAPIVIALLSAALLAGTPAMAQQTGAANAAPKPATATTERANDAVRKAMAMNDKQDFEDATRGKLAELKDPLVKAADGRVVWDTQRYAFIKGDAPATVNPSLWRQQTLNTAAGPVQGGRRHLPDPRLRPRQHDAGRRRDRLDRDRHAC